MFRSRLYARAVPAVARGGGAVGSLRFPCASAWTAVVGGGLATSFALRVPRALYGTARSSGGGGKGSQEGDNEEGTLDFEFDPMASMQHDAAVETAKKSFRSVLEELLPEGAPPAAVEKVRQYLRQHPVDSLITATNVQITHVQNPETGAEERVSLSPVPLAEALEQSEFRKLNLVQMGSNDDVAFCRIRDEKPWVYKLIAEDMKAYEEEQAAKQQQQQQQQQQQESDSGHRGRGGRRGGLKSLVDVVFRDAVDAHFIGWKSKKVCEEIRKGHPVKLTVREFQSAESAMLKLREMSNAMRRYAEEKKIYHHFTSIVANDREASVTFSPSVEDKTGQMSRTVRHPDEKEWARALKQMQNACERSGRLGTYAKSGYLKPRNVGSSLYRTDKYGRRIE